MNFIVERDRLLKPLQHVSNILKGRPTLPILNNILLKVTEDCLLLTTTDSEVEIVARLSLNTIHNTGTTTVSARKFLDICRGLSDGSKISILLRNERLIIYSGRSCYSLSTSLASNFPNLSNWQSYLEFNLSKLVLKRLIESTQFSMAHNDVRYYLNGMLFKTEGKKLHTVATDGHRLALCTISTDKELPLYSIIIPRKGVIELVRILDNNENQVKIQINNSSIRAYCNDYIFTSKLIDGRFPNYLGVLPKNVNKILKSRCDVLKQALSRAAILSNEKFRGVRFYLTNNQLKITANNSEQEKAEEIIDVSYQGKEMEICFNVNYILDVLNTLKCEEVKLLFTDEMSSVQIEDTLNKDNIYIIMPMRL